MVILEQLAHTYLVRVCIAILNFTVALNYVKPLLRSNHQNEEISSSLMMVATRLDSRSKLDSFLTFCERTSILINEACFNVILDSCIKLKNNKRLLRIINKFRVWGLLPNIQTFGIIIKTLSSSNLIHDCEELFYHYITAQNTNTANGVNTNTTTNGTNNTPSSTVTVSNGANNSEIVYGCMFDAYVNNNSVDSAMRLFEDMKERGKVKPNTIMYTTLIKGYGQNKQLDKAMRIFRLMQQDGVEPNTVTYNSIIDACARVGEMGSATRLLEEMLSSGIEPDLITFSTIIKGYCVQSDMDKSFQLLSVMYERGIMPDVILYNSLLEGCVKSGLLWLCEKLWSQMQEYNIPPSNFTLTILIKMYGRSGQLDKVFELADELPKRYNFSINTHVYTCLMSACITNGRYAMVLDIYKYMKINGVKPDAKTFETIIQGLSRGSLFKEAAHVVTEVYSLSNSNNGEAQIPNINIKILQRLFQRFYNSVNPNTHNTNTIHSPNTNGTTHTNGNTHANNATNTVNNNVILLSTASSGVLGGVDDAEELNSIYTSLARRLELFGIKVPKY
ncbi:uncharacterized protein TA04350 [Theileria annulata]|uniref:Pentatricopeptide repeat-containing protein n=1 Tax=Theileria annulata TaxID=5874 RepID=Q4UC39_THEAN|nr:uncharacterized protein TA04350 [Theileria annulata]CAI75612.1 hypothetical protein, conserved [Theileria annulata]|eukprot:XP_955088.1 hypothetical protein, conserved [Theileria annulata]